MNQAVRTGLLVSLILVSLTAMASTPQPCQVVASNAALDDAFGVNIDFTDPRTGEMKMLAGAGFRWVRMDLKWDATETEPGRYDFTAYDRLMSALENEKVRALFILDYGNPLYDNGAPPKNEATRGAFVRWAVAAAKHFAGRGVLWEVYNEPNHEQFWPPRPNVADYVALALAVGRAFDKEVPDEKLIGPATSGIDLEFLEACFKGGLLRYWSAVSVHPYRREGPETVTFDYCRLRQLVDKYAPTIEKAKIPIIAGEWGYSSVWRNVTAAKQGELLARSWLTNVANGVRLSVWYDWRDDGLDPRNAEHHFGTVGNVYLEHAARPYDPKPAYLAASTLTSFFSGYRFTGRLPIGTDEDYVLQFRKGDEIRFAAWTTSIVAHEVVIPLAPGFYAGIECSGLAVSSRRVLQSGLAVKLSNAPFYIKKIH